MKETKKREKRRLNAFVETYCCTPSEVATKVEEMKKASRAYESGGRINLSTRWKKMMEELRKDCGKHPENYDVCTKCGHRTIATLNDCNTMGDFSWKECLNESCGHQFDHESQMPKWMIEESRPASGPGSRAPYGMGIRDEFGGL